MTDAWLSKLTQPQRERLKRFNCAWCEMRLDRGACSAIYGQCSEETRRKRGIACLKASGKTELRDTAPIEI